MSNPMYMNLAIKQKVSSWTNKAVIQDNNIKLKDSVKRNYSYTNVSANDDIKWKNADTNRWELSDKFE